jgi:hypothetical protein
MKQPNEAPITSTLACVFTGKSAGLDLQINMPSGQNFAADCGVKLDPADATSGRSKRVVFVQVTLDSGEHVEQFLQHLVELGGRAQALFNAKGIAA